MAIHPILTLALGVIALIIIVLATLSYYRRWKRENKRSKKV